jgi:hypothetical protein
MDMVGLVMPMVFGLLAAIAARSHYQEVDDKEIYKYPAAIGYLMLGAGIVFACVPFLPAARGSESISWMFVHILPFSVFPFCLAIYFFRFRLTLDDVAIEYGAFKRSRVLLADVIDTQTDTGDRTVPQLTVYLRGGKCVRFTGLISDFERLSSALYIAGLPDRGPIVASPTKLKDRRRSIIYGTLAILIGCVAVGVMLWFSRDMWPK